MDDQARKEQVKSILDQIWNLYNFSQIDRVKNAASISPEFNHKEYLQELYEELQELITQLKIALIKDLNEQNIPITQDIVVEIISDQQSPNPNHLHLSENSKTILTNISSLYEKIWKLLTYQITPRQ